MTLLVPDKWGRTEDPFRRGPYVAVAITGDGGWESVKAITRTEERSQREMMRRLKRYIAHALYAAITVDPASREHNHPSAPTTILCGNPGFGITRSRL